MATANPDDAYITCKNPDCPKGVFKCKTILKHIAMAKNCKKFYKEEEIEEMRDFSKNLLNSRRAEFKRKENCLFVPSTSGMQNFQKPKTQCKICKKMYIVLLKV